MGNQYGVLKSDRLESLKQTAYVTRLFILVFAICFFIISFCFVCCKKLHLHDQVSLLLSMTSKQTLMDMCFHKVNKVGWKKNVKETQQAFCETAISSAQFSIPIIACSSRCKLHPVRLSGDIIWGLHLSRIWYIIRSTRTAKNVSSKLPKFSNNSTTTLQDKIRNMLKFKMVS